MTYFLLLTAFTVSIDSLVCGFSLALNKNGKLITVAVIALTVYVMCAAANYLAAFLGGFLTEKTASLGGLILVGVGIFNLIKKDKSTEFSDNDTIRQSLVTGFAVGLDGAAANLSLSLMGVNAFYVPIVIAAMHALTVAAGIALSQTPLAKKFDEYDFVPPVILVALGLYKLSALFL